MASGVPQIQPEGDSPQRSGTEQLIFGVNSHPGDARANPVEKVSACSDARMHASVCKSVQSPGC